MHNSFSAATFLLSVAQLHQLPPPDKPEAAFAGRSNSGKSSALNALCGHKGLARVSKTPGRTQLLNFFELDGEHGLRPRHGALSREAAKVGAGAAAVAGHGTNPNGDSVRPGLIRGRLVDLPGYGFADVPLEVRRQWGPLINGYLRGRECLRGIVLIMDIRHPLTDFDQQMLSWARDGARPVHILLTKSDKLSPGAARQVLKTVQKELAEQESPPSLQLFSAQTKAGVEEARGKLLDWLA